MRSMGYKTSSPSFLPGHGLDPPTLTTPLTTSDPPHEYRWDYASPTTDESSWDSSCAPSCADEASCCIDSENYPTENLPCEPSRESLLLNLDPLHRLPDPSLDSKESFPTVFLKDGPLPSAAHRQRKTTTMVSRPKRPWLTQPPRPTNMAWRGWERSETLTKRLRPSRQTFPYRDFSLSANEKPNRPPIQQLRVNKQSRMDATHIHLVKEGWTPRSSARRRMERCRIHNRQGLAAVRCTTPYEGTR
jgi:hypothetical protein